MKPQRFSLSMLLVACALFIVPAGVQAGIRVDGTEFQSASDVASRAITKHSPDTIHTPVKIILTMAQAVMARGEIIGPMTAVKIGLGYEYNVQKTSGYSCTCPHQGDFDQNGFLDAVDLNAEIDVLFFGGMDPWDSGCPVTRADFNADGFPDAIDLNLLIDHLFFGGDLPIDPCVN